jgi:hypothetical protein
MTGSFLAEPPVSAEVQALYDEDLAEGGYVWNASRLWAHQPDTLKQPFGFSTINDSLGAQPDAQLAQSLPREVREAVSYGRPAAQASAV